LWADAERCLSAADPTGREQRIACGAALFNLRLALQTLGVRPLVRLHPDADQPDLLAVVRQGGHQLPTPAQLRLHPAVARRHTNWLPFTDEPVAAGERAALRHAATKENAWLHLVEDRPERQTLARLAAEAHTLQQTDPDYLAEAARWTAVGEGRDDGVPPDPASSGPPPTNGGSSAISPAARAPRPPAQASASNANQPSRCSPPTPWLPTPM
jgi:hypothetical protein